MYLDGAVYVCKCVCACACGERESTTGVHLPVGN